MLTKLPIKFFSGCGCSSGTGSVPSGATCPTATAIATICDQRYLTLTAVPYGKLIVVPPGADCQTFMENSDAEAMVVSVGGALGYKPTKEPKLSLPKLVGSPTSAAPAPFPYIMIAGGSGSTTPWQMLPCPTAGEWYIKGTTGGWTLVENSPQATQLGVTFAAAATGTTLEAIGFVDVGSGVYQPRRLIGSGTLDVPMMLHWNSVSGRYEMKAAAITDSLHIGTIKATFFGEVSTGGTPTSDSFTLRPNSGIVQADVRRLMINGPTGQIYREPDHLRVQITNNASPTTTVALNATYQDIASHLDFGTRTFNYPTAIVCFDVQTDAAERITFGVFVDGVLRHEFNYSNATGASYSSPVLHHGFCIISGIALGDHAVRIRVKGTTANCKIEYTNGCLVTL